MSTALQPSTLTSTFEGNHAADVGEQAIYPLEERFRPDCGSSAPDRRLHNGHGAATVSLMLARVTDANMVRFGDHLQNVCEELAATCRRPRGPTLTWSAAEADLPIHVATTFGLIADLLITRIYVHGFPPGRGGRIDASFTLDDDVWTLTIDDSGLPIQSLADPRCDGLTIARQAILRHTGWLETPRMKAGTRFTIVIPRSTQAFFHKAMSAALAASVPSWPGRSQLIEAVAQARLAIPAPVPSTPPNGTPTALADAAGL